MKKLTLFASLLGLLLTACKEIPKKSTDSEALEQTMPNLAVAPQNWIDNRVKKSKQQLQHTEAGKVVWKAMETHGGLANWYAKGPLSFRFNYRPLDGSTQRDTYQIIDTWRSTARHYHAKDSTQQFGWDGNQAWQMTTDSTAFTYNTRFWALTPYFFMAQPFVLDGAGVNLELLPKKIFNKKEQEVIKVTFDAGTGDAPDDYYVLYFDADTHQLSVIRYIVSYSGYFKDGGHSPEKIMELGGYQSVDGILLPTTYKTHWLTQEEALGEHITDINVSEVSFQYDAKKVIFDIPERATIVEGL